MNKEGIDIRIEGLTKHFGKIHALDDLTLQVKKGSIFGYLGPNDASFGAAKASLTTP